MGTFDGTYLRSAVRVFKACANLFKSASLACTDLSRVHTCLAHADKANGHSTQNESHAWSLMPPPPSFPLFTFCLAIGINHRRTEA